MTTKIGRGGVTAHQGEGEMSGRGGKGISTIIGGAEGHERGTERERGV